MTDKVEEQQHQNPKFSGNEQVTDQGQQSTKTPKIQIPISWREELYMVKEKVLEEIEYVFKECIEIDTTGDDAERLELMQIKNHFKKRLKGFYNNVIITFRDNVEYINFDDAVKRKKQQILYTQKDLTLEGNNQESLGQFRELLSRTDGLRQKIQLDIQDQLQREILEKKEKANQQDKSNSNQSQNTFEKLKVKDEKGNEKSLNLPGYIKEAIEKQVETMKKEVNRIKQMHPHLTDRLKEFHLHTRGHIKKTIELQYALESIKQSSTVAAQQGKSDIFAIPSIPSSLFE